MSTIVWVQSGDLSVFLGILAVTFVFGAIVGSFLNVCIHRLPHDMSVVLPASHCPACETPLRAFDNIPFVSFLALRGRCRSCNVKISWRYPLVEGLNGLAYVLDVVRFGLEPATLVYALLLSTLIVVTFIDLDHQIIPNEITFPGMPLGLIAAATVLPISWLDSLIGLLCGGGVLFFVVWISPYIFRREGMGMGDVKLLAMLGAFLGWKATLLTLLLGSFSGAVVGGGLMATKLIKHSEPIPFGPFLALGAVLALFFGGSLIEWYSGFFELADPLLR
ncbi:MAG TPA: prepilin peptidase [Nitrospirales bacterium]|nr:prepilin peptidase [Nitrospirales bacterium]HIN32435.1 prepilin peptidase [Nitrospirales bacterium]